MLRTKPGKLLREPLGKPLASFVGALLLIAVAASAGYSGQPVIWETSGRAELLKGDARGVSISDTGVLMLAPRLSEVFNTEQAFVWSSTVDSQGNVYLGTGHDGKIFRVSADGKGSLLYDAAELDVTALATGYLATGFGLRPVPELLGAGYAIAGLALSVLAVRDTAAWARAEARQHPRQDGPHPPFREIALRVSWTDRTLAAVSQAGLVSNLNDGLVWVVLPVLLVSHGVSVTGVGYIKALYPFMWAAGMIATGHLADRIGRKPPVVAGMLIQAAGLAVITAGISHALAAGLAEQPILVDLAPEFASQLDAEAEACVDCHAMCERPAVLSDLNESAPIDRSFG